MKTNTILLLAFLLPIPLLGQGRMSCGARYDQLVREAIRNYQTGELTLALNQFKAAGNCQEADRADLEVWIGRVDRVIKKQAEDLEEAQRKTREAATVAKGHLEEARQRALESARMAEVALADFNAYTGQPVVNRGVQSYDRVAVNVNTPIVTAGGHCVQFGIYESAVEIDKFKAPPSSREVLLVNPRDALILGVDADALYLVEPFQTEAQARSAAKFYKEQYGVDCWYNPKLTWVSWRLLQVITP